MLLILIILLILFGGGGGYRTYHYGARDPGGLLVLVLMIILIVWLINGALHVCPFAYVVPANCGAAGRSRTGQFNASDRRQFSLFAVEPVPLSKSKKEVEALASRRGVVLRLRRIIFVWLRRIVVVRLRCVIVVRLRRNIDGGSAAAIAAIVMIAATTTIAAAVLVGASGPDPEAADHEGKRDSRRDPAYLRARCLFRLGRYLHIETPSRDRLPAHLFSLAPFFAAARARLRNRESAIFFCASEKLL